MKRSGAGHKDKGGGKRSKKQYFQGSQGKKGGGGGLERKQFEAKDGFKGVLATCEGKHREPMAVRELFNLLNEYAEALFPDAEAPQASASLSVEDSLAQEIAGIKSQAKDGLRKFYVLETNVKGVIFIRFTDPRMQPVPFITHILEDLHTTKQQKSKNVVRLLPIEKTCAVQMDKVLELINELARPHFPSNPPPDQKKPFTILFKRRNNDQVRQMDTIEAATKLLSDVGVLNFRRPEITILVEIFQRACGVGVIPHGAYERLEDFNLRRIYEKDQSPAPAPAPSRPLLSGDVPTQPTADDPPHLAAAEDEGEGEGEEQEQKESSEQVPHPTHDERPTEMVEP